MTESQKNTVTSIALIVIGISVVIGGYFLYTYAAQRYEKVRSDRAALTERDRARKVNVSNIASNLVAWQLVLQGEDVAQSQDGLDQIAVQKGEHILDPLTKKPYVYTKNQSTMKVGEVYFGVGLVCDNKVNGSKGAGLLTGGSSRSVGVTTKLESGGYACQSNL